MPTHSLLVFEMTIFRNSIQSGTEFYCQWRKSHLDDILEGLYKLRIRESEKTQDRIGIVEYCYSQTKSRTWLPQIEDNGEKSIEQNTRFKTFEVSNGKLRKKKKGRGHDSGDKTAWTKKSRRWWQWKANGTGDNCSFRHEINKRAKTTQWNLFPYLVTKQNQGNALRNISPRDWSPSRKLTQLSCKDYIKKFFAPNHSVKNDILIVLFYKSENGCKFDEKCSCTHRQIEEQPRKRFKMNEDKKCSDYVEQEWVASKQKKRKPVLDRHSSNTWKPGCVLQDMEPPKSSSILRKRSNIRKSIRCIKFTEAVVCHADIREKNPSLGMICPEDAHQRDPMLQNLRIGLKKRQKSKSDVSVKQGGNWLKAFKKLKEKNKAVFFSPSENSCLPASSNLKPEESEFVVDSGASMHMISKKKKLEFCWIGYFDEVV